MLVTFIGGPLHGTQQAWEVTPQRYGAENSDGTWMQYEQRGGTAEGVTSLQTFQVFYAPVGMSVEDFFRLSKEVSNHPGG